MTNRDTISRSVSALAESIGTIVDLDEDQAAALATTFDQAEQYLKDNVADETESTPSFSQQFSSPRAAERALACVLAARQRLRKSEEPETKESLEFARDAILKSINAVSLCKVLVEDSDPHGISE